MPNERSSERVVKRYDNRKLYDTEARAYVTLDDLARLVAEGHELKVVDQRSGEDLTTLVLAQVILEGIKQRTASVPRQVLTRLIRLGGQAGRVPGPRDDTLARAREEAERIVARLLTRGRLPLEEALSLRQEIAHSLQRVVGDTQRGLEQTFHSLMEWSERESGVSPAIQALKERLLTLETYLGNGRSEPARPRARRRPKRR